MYPIHRDIKAVGARTIDGQDAIVYAIMNPLWNKVFSSVGKRSAFISKVKNDQFEGFRNVEVLAPLRKGKKSERYYFAIKDSAPF